jgi:hypothetical protein
LIWDIIMAAAATVTDADVSTFERWLPSIVSILGVLSIALVTAFRIGNKFTVVTQTVAQLAVGLDEQKLSLKDGLEHASEGRKELHGKVDELKEKQIEHGKDIEHNKGHIKDLRYASRKRTGKLRRAEPSSDH